MQARMDWVLIILVTQVTSRKIGRFGPRFQTIFPFLMTMKIHSCKSVHLIQYFAKTIFLVKMLILLCLTCDCPSCYKYKHLTKKMIYERRKALLWRCVLNRSSHQRCSVKKGVLRNFAKFIGKHLCQRLFFNKVLFQ